MCQKTQMCILQVVRVIVLKSIFGLQSENEDECQNTTGLLQKVDPFLHIFFNIVHHFTLTALCLSLCKCTVWINRKTDGRRELPLLFSTLSQFIQKATNRCFPVWFYSDDTSNVAKDDKTCTRWQRFSKETKWTRIRRRRRRMVCQPGKHTFPANSSPTMVKNMERTKRT